MALGTGEDAWVEFGVDTDIVQGPQLGWHIVTSASVSHTRSAVRIDVRVFDVLSGLQVGGSALFDSLEPVSAPCGGEKLGIFAFLNTFEMEDGDRELPYELLHGHEVDIELTVEDDDGRFALDSVRVVAVSPDL